MLAAFNKHRMLSCMYWGFCLWDIVFDGFAFFWDCCLCAEVVCAARTDFVNWLTSVLSWKQNTVEPRFTNLIRSWRPFVTWNVYKLNFFGIMVSYLIIYIKKHKTIKFKRRHGKFEQGCLLSESYTATDALLPILPACHQPLLPACVFITWDAIRHPRRFLFGKFVCDERRSWTEVPLYCSLSWPFFL
jgi:hypothetical protein